ncbi:MAG: chorismate mutase [Chloroflexota bacterium]|nr:MAG: chorismate mutase [Chloroflexota bacterium]
MWCRGIRGATTVETNTRDEILSATRELLQNLVEANDFALDDVASAYFTTTPDVNAEFPAVAARQLGWNQVPLLCGHEMQVPDSLGRCIRVLLHVNTEKKAGEITHIYLRGAVGLRDPNKVPSIE